MKTKKLKEDQNFNAMQLCWKYLSYRSRSEKELELYLKKKKFNENIIKSVIKRIKELGYINDIKFAREWALNRKNQNKGPELIRFELSNKGISAETIKNTLESMYENNQEETKQIRVLALKLLNNYSKNESYKALNSAAGKLARRGFNLSKIIEVINDLRREVNEH